MDISNYIKSPSAIIICVMQAREDIEADYALEFIKEYDPNFKQVLTSSAKKIF